MVTNKKTGKTVKANKMTNDAVKSIKKTRQTLKLEQEAKKQSQQVNKVAKMPTNKIDLSKPSATRPIKEPIATKNKYQTLKKIMSQEAFLCRNKKKQKKTHGVFIIVKKKWQCDYSTFRSVSRRCITHGSVAPCHDDDS